MMIFAFSSVSPTAAELGSSILIPVCSPHECTVCTYSTSLLFSLGRLLDSNYLPGCACDVPSALYSFSFALNPNWTKLMPSNKEIKEYHDGVVKQYGLREKMVFHTEVRKCVWRDDANRWLLFLINLETGKLYTHECQILFAATGQLIEPRPCDFPGASTFKGTIFHSARWDHSVNLEGKNVVVVGNGCELWI